MHDAGQHRLERPTALDQPLEPMLRRSGAAAVSSAPELPASRSRRPDPTGPCIGRPARRSLDRAASPAPRAVRSSPPIGSAPIDLHRGRADRTSRSRKGRAGQCGQHRSDDARSRLALARAGEHVPLRRKRRPRPASRRPASVRSTDAASPGAISSNVLFTMVLHGGTSEG